MPEPAATEPRPLVVPTGRGLVWHLWVTAILGLGWLAVGAAIDLLDWRSALPGALGVLTFVVFAGCTGRAPKSRVLAQGTPRAVAADDLRVRTFWPRAAGDLGGLVLLTVLATIAIQDLALPALVYLASVPLFWFDLRVVRAWEREHGATLVSVPRHWRRALRDPFRPSEQLALGPGCVAR